MEVIIQHLGSVQFEIRARHHSLICDQPVEAGGFDEGVTPPELMLASLGSCAAFYAADYLRRRELITEGTSVRVTANKLKDPPRLGEFLIEVNVPLELTAEDREGVERAVHRCLIHSTLSSLPKMELQVHSPVPSQ